MNDLRTELRDFDGRRHATLEITRDTIAPSPGVLRQCVQLATGPEDRLANGATWLLRAWIEGGARVSDAVLTDLAAALPGIADPWARLHVCQLIRSLAIPEARADEFAEFLDEHRASERPFVRAWAIDGLHRLAAQHPRFANAAAAALDEGRADPAPSVRARIRRIERGD